MIEFRAQTKRARLHDPRRDFALTEIESEVRQDPLTGDSARICHFALRAPPAPDLAAIDALSRPACPFCPERLDAITPRFPADLVPGGRLRHGGATLVPNLFPYDDHSAIAVLCSEHMQRMDAMPERLVADGLAVARAFIGITAGRVAGGAAYGIVTWNYMPASGGSQVHPHMQVVTTATPGNALARQLVAAEAFRARTGGVYAEALVAAERGGARWIGEQGRVAWIAPFTPTGVLGDAMAVVRDRATLLDLDEADIADLAASTVRVLKAFAARGLWSFNLCLLPDAFGVAPRRHCLTARLLPRFYLNPKLHVSDASYLQLLLDERFAMLTPEEVASDLRARFRPA
jgi:galactose-1-phosphate uridylyltransferase